ncbi:CD109 antigen-like protein [Leptotrombidium deliense]|uniref:CD109 antigen-like protein n=1 Tax=Leptotrombidium deliense TaxID=299467 RepID=A0A443SC15_9ACAR|nr:CD109 antigen-like protein [Leptotrombidium deliense]
MQSKSGENSAALTAYVFIALISNNSNDPTVNEKIKKTENYLVNRMKTTNDIYEMSIITYALYLRNSSEKESAFEKLIKASKSNADHTFWKYSDNDEAASTEMSSYALMSLMMKNEIEKALPVLRYLISKQNSKGGFSSTQDTVIGIQGMASFAEKFSNKSPSLKIDVKSEQLKNEIKSLGVNSENSIVLQEMLLSPKTQKVTLTATGEGSAIMQLSYQYNIMNTTSTPAFEIRQVIDEGTAEGIMSMTVFTKYLKGKQSGMAVMEVTLPSGFKADLEALENLKKSGIKRVETKNENTVVVLYFDEIKSEESSVNIIAERSVKVANLSPVPITVYDYYDKSKTATIFYSPKQLSVCSVCDGSDCGKSCQH